MPHLFINDILKFFYLPYYKICLLLALCLLLMACGGSSSDSNSGDGILTISGTITVQRDSDVDLDLNSKSLLNNTFEDPQFVSNPSTIGGYLSGFLDTYSS